MLSWIPFNENGGGNWNITGTQTLAENMPVYADGHYFKYTGPVWGHATRGATVGGGSVDYNNGAKVSGKVTAWYFPFREFGPQVDGASSHIDGVTLSLSQMKKELPNGEYRGLPGMMFPGLGVGDNVATFNGPSSMEYNNRRDRKYGPATGYIEGSFYGPNGESAAGTFNYTRRGHKIEGAFGAKR